VDLVLPDSGSVDKREFFVEKDNPELNDVRPDFAQMYQLASSAKPVLARMEDEKKKERLAQVLKTPANLSVLVDEVGDDREGAGGQRLYFTLDTADIIPDCMTSPPPKTGRHKAGLEDLWTKGPTVTREAAAEVLTVALLGLGLLAGALALVSLLGFLTGRPVLISIIILCSLSIMTAGLGTLAVLLGGGFIRLALVPGIAAGSLLFLTLLMRPSDKPVQFSLIWLGITAAVMVLLVFPLLVVVLMDTGIKPIMVGYLLMAIVAFLSLEWLTRKLLKLA
jgi:hypothetical protein